MNYHPNFEENKIYHVFARANGKEKMFISNDDYELFMIRLQKYILPIAEIYAYSLIPNHYHLMIKIKGHDELLAFKKFQNANFIENENWLANLITHQFSNFQNSYCKKINFLHKRKGSLFIERLRRLEVKDDDQFTATVFYIHKNPVHHSLAANMRDWPHSSYHQYLSEENSFLTTQPVIDQFGGMKFFLRFHSQEIFSKAAVELEN